LINKTTSYRYNLKDTRNDIAELSEEFDSNKYSERRRAKKRAQRKFLSSDHGNHPTPCAEFLG